MTITDKMYPIQHLPDAVTQVKKELIKSFSHSKRVGGYLLGRTLGVGSFAKVKEGLHLTTGEKVAIKVIDKKRTKTDNYVRKNLRREGRLLQMVRHPNIVSLLEVMETDNSYYLVTEICKGGDLMEYISTRKRLPEAEVTKFISQIVSAVDYLHRLGIIHRDLKIENLLLDGNKDIKLIDFGLSNFIKVITTPDGAKSQEFCVTQCGSPAYAAPELLNHEKYGLQVDLWSIGVNMYAMLTGGLPFTVEPFNIKALYAKMRDRQMNPLPDDLSRECRDLLRKFLNPDPVRRVTIVEALNHSWLMQRNKSISRVPCPNKVKTSDLEPEVLSHLSENLGFRMGEVIRFVTCNTPSPACATYHLFVEKLHRYNAKLRSSGQVPATLVNRSPGDEGQGRITLHLRDMRSKQLDFHRNATTTGNGTPVPRVQSRAINSVATDATDTTVATTDDSVTGRNKSTMAAAAERKENQKPQRATTDVRAASLKSPSLSDICTTDDNRKEAMNGYPKHQQANQRISHHEPLFKGHTTLGDILNNNNNKNASNEGVRQNNIMVKSAKSEQGHVTRIHTTKIIVPSDDQINWTPSANTIVVKLSPRNPTQTRNSQQLEKPTTGANQGPKPFLESTNVNIIHRNGFPDRSQHANPFIQHRKMLTRQTPTGRSFDSTTNNNNNNNNCNNNSVVVSYTNEKNGLSNSNSNNMGTEAFPAKSTSSSQNPEPTVRKIIPKQFVPFRSAQDRPKASKNYVAASLRHFEKSKTSDNMSSITLHGKTVRIPSEEDSNPPPIKRPGSPHRPVVVRRRLVKRHRLGDITGSGGQMIRDVDQSVTTELLGSDGFGPIGNGHHVSTPLPSIGQSGSPR